MMPKAIRDQAMVRGNDGLLRLEMVEAGREVVLDPMAEIIWDLCDGSRSIEDLVQAAGRAFDQVVHKEEVFSALDFLADAGLIEERVAPPVAELNVSRRSLLSRIAPVVSAAAWMMSGASARAGGLLQYSESDSKESSNKAAARESNDKENGRKASDHYYDNKERDDKERDNKDWNRQQDAEKQRKSDFKRSVDEISESERERKARAQYFEKKIKASWPKVYDIVGHRLSEFPELRQCWEMASASVFGGAWSLTAGDYRSRFDQKKIQFSILLNIVLNRITATRVLFASAGFDLPFWPPFLVGDSQNKTCLTLEHTKDPAMDDNWRYALDADNLKVEHLLRKAGTLAAEVPAARSEGNTV
jgi:hypothetical protein